MNVGADFFGVWVIGLQAQRGLELLDGEVKASVCGVEIAELETRWDVRWADGDGVRVVGHRAFIVVVLPGDFGHLKMRSVVVRDEGRVLLKGVIRLLGLRGREMGQGEVIARDGVIGFCVNGVCKGFEGRVVAFESGRGCYPSGSGRG